VRYIAIALSCSVTAGLVSLWTGLGLHQTGNQQKRAHCSHARRNTCTESPGCACSSRRRAPAAPFPVAADRARVADALLTAASTSPRLGLATKLAHQIARRSVTPHDREFHIFLLSSTVNIKYAPDEHARGVERRQAIRTADSCGDMHVRLSVATASAGMTHAAFGGLSASHQQRNASQSDWPHLRRTDPSMPAGPCRSPPPCAAGR